CEGGVVDTLVYGPVNEDGLVDDSGGIAVTLGPTPEDDASISRWPRIQLSAEPATWLIAANPCVVPLPARL
ncbi:MAG: hypothetical protein QGI11_16520, partial [Nitrospinota bacterium]|nr:hypothetical protein [Nitrospinota bacterium]